MSLTAPSITFPHPSGEIIPTFEEEIYARDTAATIYSEIRQKDKALNDGYWNDLVKIQAAKFMSEYVWTYLQRASWSRPPEPARLKMFLNWSRQNLQNHKPVTHGGLTVTSG